MLTKNYDVNIQDAFGWTALHTAVFYNTGTDAEDEILNLLFKHPGIVVDIPNYDDNYPLHYFSQKFTSPSAAHFVQTFLQRGPKTINQQNKVPSFF